jgi:hypothetical protein
VSPLTQNLPQNLIFVKVSIIATGISHRLHILRGLRVGGGDRLAQHIGQLCESSEPQFFLRELQDFSMEPSPISMKAFNGLTCSPSPQAPHFRPPTASRSPGLVKKHDSKSHSDLHERHVGIDA